MCSMLAAMCKWKSNILISKMMDSPIETTKTHAWTLNSWDLDPLLILEVVTLLARSLQLSTPLIFTESSLFWSRPLNLIVSSWRTPPKQDSSPITVTLDYSSKLSMRHKLFTTSTSQSNWRLTCRCLLALPSKDL